jgi:hypothetical protein
VTRNVRTASGYTGIRRASWQLAVRLSGHETFIMKVLSLALTAGFGAAVLSCTAPALAQYNQNSHTSARHMTNHRNNAVQYRNYRGHRAYQRNGHWGYYQPRNGVQIWITVPL